MHCIAFPFRTMRERRQLYQKNLILVTIAGIIINSRTLFAYSSECNGRVKKQKSNLKFLEGLEIVKTKDNIILNK